MKFLAVAQRVLKEVQQELPADMIAETALDRGWCTSQAASRKQQILSLQGILHSAITRPHLSNPPGDHIFYREKGQHPKIERMGVWLYGLKEWQRNGPAPSNNGSVSQAAPVSRVTIPLEGGIRENIELLVRSGKYPSATEAVLAAVGWGLEAKTKELDELKELEELKEALAL